jgi:ADP-ribosylglycohydrolase
MNDIKNNIKGLFWGQIIGDSVGEPYNNYKKINMIYNIERNKTFNFLKIINNGTITYHTELTLCMWYVLLNDKKLVLEHMVTIFFSWYKNNPIKYNIAHSNSFIVGDVNVVIKNVSKNSYNILNHTPLINCSIATITTLNYGNFEDMINFTKDICKLTNPNPICIDMAVIYVIALYTALTTSDPIKTFSIAYSYAELDITKKILIASIDTNTTVLYYDNTYVTTDGLYSDYIGIPFQNAFYQLMQLRFSKLNDNFYYNSILSTLKLGGCTSVNCSVSGSLIGACMGFDKIPNNWYNVCSDYKNKKSSSFPPFNHQHTFSILLSQISKL